MDISSNGLMSALPFVFQLLTKIVFASIADILRSREILTHSAVAKLFNLIASVGSGICFLMLAFCDCSHQFLAVSLAVMAIGLSSGYIPGYNTSVVCIAPRYTSSVASFSRLLGNIASVASPYMLGFFGDREEWNLAFFAIAFVLISTGFLFQLCGSASIQEWAMHIPHHTGLNNPDAQKDDTIAFWRQLRSLHKIFDKVKVCIDAVVCCLYFDSCKPKLLEQLYLKPELLFIFDNFNVVVQKMMKELF
uniref:Uncharacterized protein n=1 Tax=Ditylenchus dipsaci TaxID=166011 RepID=A0A915D377_9BILA